MIHLDIYLEEKFSNNRKVILNGSIQEMEGEHKICNIIKNDENFKQHNLVIYGLDADLFMLGLLLHKNGNNIYLYKETRHFDYINNIDSNELYYFDIQTFSEHLALKLNNEKNQAICDYCLLAFLCGNDFLPHLYSINIRNNGISYIIDKYLELDGQQNPLINIETGNINWKHFRKYFLLLIENETEKLLENLEWKIGLKSRVRALNNNDKLELLPCMDNEKEIYLSKNIDDFENLIYCNTNVKEMSKNYIEMIEWTWYYYYNNNVKDNSKFYKYSESPLLKDIIIYIPVINSETILNTTQDYNNINMNTLLFYVIPFDEQKQIVRRKIYDKVSNIIYDKMPLIKETNYEIDYFLCKYFWEGHLKINHIDIFELNSIIIDNI
uniref:Xrn Family 5'-3' Exonuclease n=1 Tax=Florenciella sp. virus SA2 TaxID=3240092 RepID=A0AB39J9K6_9VIRU